MRHKRLIPSVAALSTYSRQVLRVCRAELEAENARLRGEELPAKPKPTANMPLVEAGQRVSSIDEGAAEGQEEEDDDEASGPAGVASGSGGPHEAVPPAADETAEA